MEESAPKRRRISPRAAARENNTEQSAAGDPPATTSTATPQARPSRRKRPSFASPTKASLSRHNPEILDRRKSRTPRALEQQAASQGGTGSGDSDDDEAAVQAQLEAESEASPPLGADGDTGGPLNVATRSSPPERPSPSKGARGLMAAQPRRSPVKPNPRPLPPPGPEPDEDLIDASRSRRARQLARTGIVPAEPLPEQPELPPTPVERGLEDPIVTSSPTGIHSSSSSPSKRALLTKSAKPSKPSPLKQPPLLAADFRGKAPIAKRVKAKDMAEPGAENANVEAEDEIADASETPWQPHELREIPSLDPHAAKRKELETLQAEIAQLEADLQLATRANKQLQEIEGPRRRGSSSRAFPLTEAELFGLVQRHLLDEEKEEEPGVSEQWLDAAMNPISLLPFGKAESLPTIDANDGVEALPDPISHHPIKMTAEEELPYLQAFTPLEFTSRITVLPQEPGKPLLQKHYITARSIDPPGFFVAKIEMTVNSKHLDITELVVSHLDPNASAELRPFLDTILKKPALSSMEMNVSIVTWAMCEWFRVAYRRARFWAMLGREVGTEEHLLESVTSLRARKRRKRRREAGEDNDGFGELSLVRDKDGKLPDDVTEKEIRQQMGRTVMEIPIPSYPGSEESSHVRIEWKIEFDWTGEAMNNISALIGAPGKWRKRDDQGDLAKIPQIFDQLVREEEDEPITAVRTVMALLAGERTY